MAAKRRTKIDIGKALLVWKMTVEGHRQEDIVADLGGMSTRTVRTSHEERPAIAWRTAVEKVQPFCTS